TPILELQRIRRGDHCSKAKCEHQSASQIRFHNSSMLHYSTRLIISDLLIAATHTSIVSLTLFLREAGSEVGRPRVSSKRWQERVKVHHSMKQALQGVKIFAQEPTLGIFRIFAVLQHIQNRLIHDRHEQTFGSSRLKVAGLSLHISKPPLWLQRDL